MIHTYIQSYPIVWYIHMVLTAIQCGVCGGAGDEIFGMSGGRGAGIITHRVKEKRGEGLAHGGAGGEEIARRGECGEQEK